MNFHDAYNAIKGGDAVQVRSDLDGGRAVRKLREADLADVF